MSTHTISITPTDTGPLAPGQDPETGLLITPGDATPASSETTVDGGTHPTQSSETAETGNGTPEGKNAPENGEKEDAVSRRESLEATLGTSGISLTTLEDEYAKGEGFSDDTYTKLEKAGFPRTVVDAYVAGLEAENLKNAVMQEKEITAVKALAGGEKGYAELTEWAKGNLTSEEIDGFNAITATNNPAAIKAAVSGLLARKQVQVGRDPKYLTGSAPGSTPPDAYGSWAEVQRDMTKPEYQSDSAFRQKVERKLSNSNL